MRQDKLSRTPGPAKRSVIPERTQAVAMRESADAAGQYGFLFHFSRLEKPFTSPSYSGTDLKNQKG